LAEYDEEFKAAWEMCSPNMLTDVKKDNDNMKVVWGLRRFDGYMEVLRKPGMFLDQAYCYIRARLVDAPWVDTARARAGGAKNLFAAVAGNACQDFSDMGMQERREHCESCTCTFLS
jgi:hypothetical protein